MPLAKNKLDILKFVARCGYVRVNDYNSYFSGDTTAINQLRTTQRYFKQLADEGLLISEPFIKNERIYKVTERGSKLVGFPYNTSDAKRNISISHATHDSLSIQLTSMLSRKFGAEGEFKSERELRREGISQGRKIADGQFTIKEGPFNYSDETIAFVEVENAYKGGKKFSDLISSVVNSATTAECYAVILAYPANSDIDHEHRLMAGIRDEIKLQHDDEYDWCGGEVDLEYPLTKIRLVRMNLAKDRHAVIESIEFVVPRWDEDFTSVHGTVVRTDNRFTINPFSYENRAYIAITDHAAQIKTLLWNHQDDEWLQSTFSYDEEDYSMNFFSPLGVFPDETSALTSTLKLLAFRSRLPLQ